MDDEMSNGKILGMGIAAWFGVIALLGITGAIMDVSGIFWQSKIGVWRENVNRQVFEQTKSYTQGQIQQLVEAHHEYMTADDAGKKALASVMREQFADFNADLVSDPELRDFLITIRNE